MKKIKLGLMAIAALAGVGGAFATTHKNARRAGTMYYAQKINSTQSVWRAAQPAGPCTSSSTLACTITSTSANVTSLPPNTFPAQFTVLNNNGKAHN